MAVVFVGFEVLVIAGGLVALNVPGILAFCIMIMDFPLGLIPGDRLRKEIETIKYKREQQR